MWVYGVRRSGGVGRDCGGRSLSPLQVSVVKSGCEEEGYGKKSGAGDS